MSRGNMSKGKKFYTHKAEAVSKLLRGCKNRFGPSYLVRWRRSCNILPSETPFQPAPSDAKQFCNFYNIWRYTNTDYVTLRLHRIHEMQIIAVDIPVAWASVSQSVTRLRPAKTERKRQLPDVKRGGVKVRNMTTHSMQNTSRASQLVPTSTVKSQNSLGLRLWLGSLLHGSRSCSTPTKWRRVRPKEHNTGVQSSPRRITVAARLFK